MKRYTVDQIVKSMSGRWVGLLNQAGWDARVFNGRHQPCPVCGGKDRFRWGGNRKGDDFAARGGAICTHCGSHSGLFWFMQATGLNFPAALQEIGEQYLRIAPEDVEFTPRPDIKRAPRINPTGSDGASRYIRAVEGDYYRPHDAQGKPFIMPGYDEVYWLLYDLVMEGERARLEAERFAAAEGMAIDHGMRLELSTGPGRIEPVQSPEKLFMKAGPARL